MADGLAVSPGGFERNDQPIASLSQQAEPLDQFLNLIWVFDTPRSFEGTVVPPNDDHDLMFCDIESNGCACTAKFKGSFAQRFRQDLVDTTASIVSLIAHEDDLPFSGSVSKNDQLRGILVFFEPHIVNGIANFGHIRAKQFFKLLKLARLSEPRNRQVSAGTAELLCCLP